MWSITEEDVDTNEWCVLDFTAARLFDGTGAPSLEDAAVLLEGSNNPGHRAAGRRAAPGRRERRDPRLRGTPPSCRAWSTVIRTWRASGMARAATTSRRRASELLLRRYPGRRQRPGDAAIRRHDHPRERLHGSGGVRHPRRDRRGITEGPRIGRRRARGHDNGWPPPLLRRCGRRGRGRPIGGPPPGRRGRGLHQGHVVRRQHPDVAPVPAGVRPRSSRRSSTRRIATSC